MTSTQNGLRPVIVADPLRSVLQVERATENKRAVWQAKQLQLALMQATIRKEERKLIGQELHDNVNQILGVVKMLVEMLKPCTDKEKEIKQKAVEYVMMAVSEIREISRELVTNRKHMKRLEESIQRIVDDLRFSTSFKVQFMFEKKVESLEEDSKLSLFRIIQEHLKNVLNYSKAKKIDITIQATKDNKVIMVVKDDGIGFDPLRVRRGIGLSNISDRALSHGGTACIKSSPGNGCILFVSIPFIS